MNFKQELVEEICKALTSYGYEVYTDKHGEYGFYTDGARVVSFGGSWMSSLNFSGNYAPSKTCGTGWQIVTEKTVPSEKEAKSYIKANAPDWTNNSNPIYTTPEQYLKTYGESSGFKKFIKEN